MINFIVNCLNDVQQRSCFLLFLCLIFLTTNKVNIVNELISYFALTEIH